MLEKCELTVVIFREREGTPAGGPNGDPGAWEELTLAMELVRAGKLDDVFLYYYEAPDSKPVATPLRDRLEQLFRAHRIFAYSYASIEDLQTKFGGHIDHWLDTWEQIPRIASFTLEQVAPTRLPATQTGEGRFTVIQPLLANLAPAVIQILGQMAVAAYQKHGPENGLHHRSPLLPF